MKKLGILAVAALLAGMTMALLGASAQATIHPIVSSECAAQESNTGAGDFQDPPGQTPDATPGQGALKAIFALLDNGALTIENVGEPGFDPDDPGTFEWGGPAYNGDNGDDHCKNSDSNAHPD